MKTEKLNARRLINWPLNTTYCHHGMPLSNGIFGALVWFADGKLMLTVNRADYWDHRGGMIWTEACNFRQLRTLLEQKKYEEAQRLFQMVEYNGVEKKPTRLPMGRFELPLKQGVTVVAAALDLYAAEAQVVLACNGAERTLRAAIHIDRPLLVLDGAATGWLESATAAPAYDFAEVKKHYDQFGIAAHRLIGGEKEAGWVQPLPEDPVCCVLSRQTEQAVLFTAFYGESEQEAERAARRQLDETAPTASDKLLESTRKRWAQLWEQAADVEFPQDRSLETMYRIGIYKMLGSSMPGAIAPTLQGPWVEEHRMAPWCGDYHFNINVQECLWPAYGANLLECLLPLFAMIDRWKPLLAERARIFAGEPDGYQMVHASDDCGNVIGKFWTGIIDHANTSWIAQMMWQYGLYARDEQFMREQVYPFMRKTLNVFERMMDDNGGQLELPVTVSPEFGGAGNEAWGKNSTFFLTNVHFLCDSMVRMIEQFGIGGEDLERLQQLRQRLPKFAKGTWGAGEEIYLWEGQPLVESHRHHSHLAMIYPFDTIAADDPEHAVLLRNSYTRWVSEGMGKWTGWSMPWAAILHARFGRGDAAYLCLRLLQDVFTMPGYATRHNANYSGFTVFTGGDVMQLDASISAAAAVLELCVQCVQGEIRLFPAAPGKLREISFEGIRAEGAFLISASWREGRFDEARITSEKGGRLRLRNPLAGSGVAVHVQEKGNERQSFESVIEAEMEAGETIRLTVPSVLR